MATAEPIVKTSGLAINYGGVKALSGVDFSVERGELRCIIGPNGAGKSTFFKLLMGIEKPTEGVIKHNGRDITRFGSFARARLGFSIKFQNIRAYQDLSVYHNLFIPLLRHHRMREIPAQVSELIEQLGLAGTEGKPVAGLSHGQIQWLAIGMSIASRPDVLLLDEPAAGMSVEETEETKNLIKRLNSNGMTIIVIEHDMTFIRNLNTKTTVLHYGRVFAEGSFSDIESNDEVRKIYLGNV